jgi:hypothetical protein
VVIWDNLQIIGHDELERGIHSARQREDVSRGMNSNAFKDSILIITFLDVGRELRNWPEPRRDNDKYPGNMQNSGMESANILRSADILSAVGGGTFCHPSSAKRLAGQYVRYPTARRMHALRHAESLKALE